jgi:outer membrane protein OmpA-like peptidoglycan-associated protein
MRTNFLILFLLLGGIAICGHAQTKGGYHSERFKDNIYVGVGVGAQLNLNPDNLDYGIGHAVTPAVNISLGKGFTPVWGGRIQALGVWSTLYSNYGLAAGRYDKIEKHYADLQADLLFNITNAISGYEPSRLFTLSAFAGPGLTTAKAFGKQDKVNFLVNGSVGLMGGFHLTDYIDLNIEARANVSSSIFSRTGNAYTDGVAFISAGATYTFGGRKYEACQKVDIDAINAEINEYKASLAGKDAEMDKLRKDLAAKPAETIKEVVKTTESEVAGKRVVFFKIGTYSLTAYERLNIKLVAETIKKSKSDKKYQVVGYADKATGTARLNQKLSEERAKIVYQALIEEGVSPDRLEWVGRGAQDVFDKNELNRVVILDVVK